MAPTPKVKRGSGVNQIPYGGVGAINDAYAEANALLQQLDDEAGDEQEYTPALDDQEEDDLMFRPTDRPDEPVTEGLPFGPGSNFRKRAQDPKTTFAKQVLSNPGSSPGDKAFASRVLNGE